MSGICIYPEIDNNILCQSSKNRMPKYCNMHTRCTNIMKGCILGQCSNTLFHNNEWVICTIHSISNFLTPKFCYTQISIKPWPNNLFFLKTRTGALQQPRPVGCRRSTSTSWCSILEQLQPNSYFCPSIPLRWGSLIPFLSPTLQSTPTELSYLPPYI